MPASAVRYCEQCGNAIAPAAKFCEGCGAAAPTIMVNFTRVRELFEHAKSMETGARDAWLEQACQGDTAMLSELRGLLATQGSFMQQPAAPPPSFQPQAAAAAAPATPQPAAATPTSSPTVPLSPGQFIGPYRLLRELGRGGFGLVYLAMRDDGAFRKNVALKLMLRDEVTPEFVQRFRQERQVLAAMDHPNIARILDGGDAPGGMPYYVMEYVQGLPLDQHCDQQQLSVAARLRLFQQVCGAVEYLHQNSLLHRDLKPSNILVSSDGVVKLLDFGIAKIVGAAALAAPELTSVQGAPMTPDFASPEQLLGATLQKTSDIYSLGVILYRLLTGRNPYKGIDEIMGRLATKKDPPPPSQNIRADLKASQDVAHLRRAMAGELDGIVLKAIRFDANQRYQSAVDFSRDVQRFLDGESVTAYQTSFGARSMRMLKRKRAMVGALAAFLVLGAFGMWQWRRAEMLDAKWTTVNRVVDAGAPAAKPVTEQIASVQNLTNTFKTDFPAVAASLPEKSTQLLKKGLNYLDRLTGGATANPDLGLAVANAYHELGTLQEASVGDGGRGAALQTYQKAANLLVTVTTTNPADARPRDLLAQVNVRIQVLGGSTVAPPSQAVATAPPPNEPPAGVRRPPPRPAVVSPPAAAPPPAEAPPPKASAISSELEDQLANVGAKVESVQQAVEPYRRSLESRGQSLNPEIISAMSRMQSSLDRARRSAAEGNEAAAKESLAAADGTAAKVLHLLGR